MSTTVRYAFLLVVVLILVVYWKGATNNINSFGSAANKLLLTLQGRKTDGSFSDYPA